MSERRLAGVALDQDVAIPRRDGTHLRADVYRPAGPAPRPVLLLRNAYDKRRAQSYWYAPPSWYAEQGYAVVVEDVRGRHRSEGRFVPLEHEADDGADLATWAVEQPWSNGRVGSYGYSYCGLNQLLTAGAGAPLGALAPALAPAGLGEGCLLQGGVQALAFAVTWAVELGVLAIGEGVGGHELTALTPDALRQVLQVRPPLRLLEGARSPAEAGWLRSWLAGDPEDPYWQRPEHRPDYERIAAPALHLAGAYDTFRAATVGHYDALRGARDGDPRVLLRLGPWTHQPARPSSPAWPLPGLGPADSDVDDLQLGFFDATLRDAPWDEPPVLATVLNSAHVWTGSTWPPKEAGPQRWHLSSTGRAASTGGALVREPPGATPPDHLVYDHGDPVPARGGDDCCDPSLLGMGPADQRVIEGRRDVLVYTSAPLDRELLVLGETTVTLHIETVEARSQWLARLCLVTVTGASVNLCEGVRRIATSEGSAIVTLDLGPLAARVAPGERLRLHVTCGSEPRWLDLVDPVSREPVVTRAVVRHDDAHPSTLVVSALP